MATSRNTTRRESAPVDGPRPFTARSVIASTLLGTHPPRLPTSALIRSGALFGISDGTVRVALSRMVATGELTLDDGRYALSGHLLSRQDRQDRSRQGLPEGTGWAGRWTMAVVDGAARPAAQRAALRDAMVKLRLAELREGVWLRPDNLDPRRMRPEMAIASTDCRWFDAGPQPDAATLAAGLWDLDGWARTARQLRREIGRLSTPLERGDADVLPDGFTLSAAVLRHLQADPLLPAELLPNAWPGRDLRADYEGFDQLFTGRWRTWLRAALQRSG